MNINYYRKNVYGVEKIYAEDMNSTPAVAIRLLTGKKTMSRMDMSNLEYLGIKFTEVIAPTV